MIICTSFSTAPFCCMNSDKFSNCHGYLQCLNQPHCYFFPLPFNEKYLKNNHIKENFGIIAIEDFLAGKFRKI